MEIILLKDVKKIGKEGDVVKVKDGYARNYLIPKKLAVLHTASAAKTLETKRKKQARLAEKEKKSARELATKISKTPLNIPMESGIDDMLFGSVTSEAIANALRQENIQIDKKNITIAEPIRKLGIYNVEVKLHSEVKEKLRIWVVKK